MTFDDLLEQARQRLVLDVCAITARTDEHDGHPSFEPVEDRYVANTLDHLQNLIAEGVPDDLELLIPSDAEALAENGDEIWLDPDEATDEGLLRIAARAVAAYALLRRAAEEQMVTALWVMDRLGWDGKSPRASLAETVMTTAANIGLVAAEATLAEIKRGARSDDPDVVVAWEAAVARLKETDR